jgi:hypothetical protein
MKNIIPLQLGAAFVAVAPGLTRAQALPQTGKVIVLDNERTMTGDIERDGEFYRVRRLNSEVSVPASKVQRLCASLKEAYEFLHGRAALNDPDERLRLAEWCKQHGLREQALGEVNAGLAMRPTDPRLRRLCATLRGAGIRPATPAGPARAERSMPRVDVSAQTMNTFAVKAQPILMNACASCHCGDYPGRFHLKRSWSGGSVDRSALEHNISAVVAQIDTSAPERSPLLRKAVSIHAVNMTVSPLRPNQMAAFRILEQWVRLAVAQNPGLTPPAPPPSAVAATPPPPAQSAPPQESTFGADRPAPVKAEPMPASDEPGAPDEFNRENHAERVAPPAKGPPPER